MRRLATMLMLISAAACGGKKKSAESCGAVTATLDGKPLPAMKHGLARAMVMNGDTHYEVQISNLDKTTCEQFADKSGTPIPEGQVAITAFAGGGGAMGKGVRFEANTMAGESAELVSPPPKAKGDKVQICVDDATVKMMVGPNKDKELKVSGLFEGPYCGEIRW
jgi:hypothetical protein